MARPLVLAKRGLISIHRWIGVTLSLVFFLWFASGIVMMYRSFPGVSERDRLERAPVLDPARITVTPEAALAALGLNQSSGAIRLTSFDGRPVYQVGGDGRRSAAEFVYADNGTVHVEADADLIDRAAVAWTRQPLGAATKESVEEVDQWTVGGLRDVRPLFKYSWADGQQVYVDGTTGEVVQYTTTASRFWAYLGAIPHWLYFTPLRKHPAEWFSVVVWSSLIGTVASLIGLIIMAWMYSPRKRYRYGGSPTSVPYRNWKRWHAIAGTFFGVVTTTWAFSGLLSMGPFPLMDRVADLMVPSEASPDGGTEAGTSRRWQAPRVDVALALRGSHELALESYAAKPAAAAIRSVAGFEVKELEWTSFAGRAVYLATNGQGDTRVIPVEGGPHTGFAPDRVMQVIREAAGPSLAELRVMDDYDAYYLDRLAERPLPVIYARLNDAAETRYYIDPRTARVAGQYNQRGCVTRWLYHGLHSLDFPWLYKYRPLWDIVVISLMLGGTALSATSLVLTWRVLARTLAAVFRSPLNQPSDDLAIETKP